MELLTLTGILIFLVEFARALPWPARWTARRPLSCTFCMVAWGACVVGLFQRLTAEAAPVSTLLAAAGFTSLLVSWRRSLESNVATWTPPEDGGSGGGGGGVEAGSPGDGGPSP